MTDFKLDDPELPETTGELSDQPEHVQRLYHDVAADKMALEKWVNERFQENPLNALDWSSSTFRVAANYQVALRLIHGFASGMSIDDAIESLERSIAHRVEYICSRSTSITSNLKDDCELAAESHYRNRLVDALKD